MLRGALRGASLLYGRGVWWKNRQFDQDSGKAQQVSVPVISVGNLTLGGTGKTPMVEWIARWLRMRQLRVSLVSRGYGAEQGTLNDEALELEQRLPDVPHLQNPDRIAAAQVAIEEFACQIILLDDGFQHRRIARDLDIVLLDALEPDGFGYLFPRGTLREPFGSLSRAHCVVLSRASLISPEQRQSLCQRVAQIAPAAAWVEATHSPRYLLTSDANQFPLEHLAGKRVAAFSGLGNPAGFLHTLEETGYQVAGHHEFPDHHQYTRKDIEFLAQWASQLQVDALVCTHKDLVKINTLRIGILPVFALVIGLELLAGQQRLEQLLESVIENCSDAELDYDEF